MKSVLVSFCLLLAVSGFSQGLSRYQFPLPEDWTRELFFIPFDFAPSIPYRGQEELRFAPGWGNVNSEQYWTYAYLWYVDGRPVINADTIKNNLEAYYTGLVGRNIIRRNIPKEKQVPVQVSVSQIKYEGNDEETYQALIHMLDYMEQKPITLQVKVHVMMCSGNHRGILFQVSPKLLSHPVWKTLNSIHAGLKCM